MNSLRKYRRPAAMVRDDPKHNNGAEDAARERLLAALAQFPEAHRALREALAAERWLAGPDAHPE